MTLASLGFGGFAESFAATAASGEIPGRVVAAVRGHYRVVCDEGELDTTLTGRAAHEGVTVTVGDWVRLAEASRRIVGVLPRTSLFARRAAGVRGEAHEHDLQLIAANIDVALIVMGLDGDFNARRIERYLTIAWDAGARPAIVLSKSDLVTDIAARVRDIEAVAPGVPVRAVSIVADGGLVGLDDLVRSGETTVLLGSSGAGKSTLLNALAGEHLQATQAVRAGDQRGRHTTTRRELFVLPTGAMVIDTPGMREIGVLAGDPDLAFSDIAAIATGCRFTDCSHAHEPGCAVVAAVVEGTLDPGRFENFRALEREVRYQRRREDRALAAQEKQRWKAITQAQRQRYKARG